MKRQYLISFFLSFVLGLSPVHAGEVWPQANPADLGFDVEALDAFEDDISNGKYGYVDSILVIRHGKVALERYYEHDYSAIYAKEARTPGPLVVHDPTGPYNYFNSWWHPYYRRGDLHSMQSVTKSVVSAVIGIAIGRNEFPSLDTPVLSFFDREKVKNVDERKEAMTVRHLLTMSTGLDWNEDVPYTDPANTFTIMAVSPDWVQYTLDRPMAGAPGEVFKYNSGATLILGHIFRLATGIDLEEYAAQHLFAPIGLENYMWKRTPQGLADAQEGLYVTSRGIAKIAYLFLKGGAWEGQQVVPEEWVRASVEPSVSVTPDGAIEYGYKWWLYRYQYDGDHQVAFAGVGFGGQRPIVLPELDMVIVTTGWNILPDLPILGPRVAIQRILEAVTE